MSVHEAHIDLWFFAREKAVVLKHVLNNDKLSTVAAVNESQNSEIEMVSWQVRLTDQVRYHQHSSSVFVGARLNGLLAPPALKLKNWNTEKSQIPWKQGLTPHTHHTHTHTHMYFNQKTACLGHDHHQDWLPLVWVKLKPWRSGHKQIRQLKQRSCTAMFDTPTPHIFYMHPLFRVLPVASELLGQMNILIQRYSIHCPLKRTHQHGKFGKVFTWIRLATQIGENRRKSSWFKFWVLSGHPCAQLAAPPHCRTPGTPSNLCIHIVYTWGLVLSGGCYNLFTVLKSLGIAIPAHCFICFLALLGCITPKAARSHETIWWTLARKSQCCWNQKSLMMLVYDSIL